MDTFTMNPSEVGADQPWSAVDRRIAAAEARLQPDLLRELVGELQAEDTGSFWARYYRALARFRLAGMPGLERDAAKRLLEQALADLDRAAEHPRAEGERLILRSCVAGQLVGHTTMLRARPGWIAEQALRQAERLCPRQPRLWLARAAAALSMARPGGSDAAQAVQELQAAAHALPGWAQPAAAAAHPSWGRSDALMLLAQHHHRQGDLRQAALVYRLALDDNPALCAAQRGWAAVAGTANTLGGTSGAASIGPAGHPRPQDPRA